MSREHPERKPVPAAANDLAMGSAGRSIPTFTALIFFLPMHPRTDLPICCFIGENCDVMSFHCYLGPRWSKMIDMAGSFGRPVPARSISRVRPTTSST